MSKSESPRLRAGGTGQEMDEIRFYWDKFAEIENIFERMGKAFREFISDRISRWVARYLFAAQLRALLEKRKNEQ